MMITHSYSKIRLLCSVEKVILACYTYEYRCKNPKQDICKLNSTVFIEDYTT